MKSYKKLLIIYFLLVVVVFFALNFGMGQSKKESKDRPYRVEISRIVKFIKEKGEIPELSEYTYIKNVTACWDNSEIVKDNSYEKYFEEINDILYRFDYVKDEKGINLSLILNISLAIFSVVTFVVLVTVFARVIVPFNRLEEIPLELARGNLNIDMEENKAKYFGKFIWGTNMLRDVLKKRRDTELALHKEKKLLLLSLTHDLRTPLSVIKLNTQALEKNLYKDEERKKKAIHDIHSKTNEIENYLSEIVNATKEDFLDFSVIEENFYLDDIISKLKNTYKSKLDYLKISLKIYEYKNVLLAGDENRLLEVLQNIFENAIKYGDGQSISVDCVEEQGYVLIAVSNTGCGVAEGELGKVFESFYRGSNVADKEGSGLGLYICRQLMSNMKGDIFAKQENDRFIVTVVVRKE